MKAMLLNDITDSHGNVLPKGTVLTVVSTNNGVDDCFVCKDGEDIHEIYHGSLFILPDDFLGKNVYTLHKQIVDDGGDYTSEMFLGKPSHDDARIFINDDVRWTLAKDDYDKLMSGEQIIVPDEYYDIEVWMD